MSLAAQVFDGLRTSFKGQIVTPDDPGYDDARRVWSALIDRRPALVVRPGDATDVSTAIRFAREHDLPIAVRSGGHSINGFSTCDDGMVLDLSAMRRVSVDRRARRARTNGGALLLELDRAVQEHGLVCPVGTVGHTGVAGLALGGGVGRLQRQFGLTVDNLTAVELVTSDGRHVRASEEENADLFWAIRGAGPNFGVVTAFEFRLHPFGPNLTRGLRIYRPEDALVVWDAFRELTQTAPRAMSFGYVIGRAWPEEEYPERLRGGPIVLVAFNHTGTERDAAAAVVSLDRAAEPVIQELGTRSYLEIQTLYDETYAWGQRYTCGTGGFADDIRPSAISTLVEHIGNGVEDAGVSLTALGGAIAEPAEDAMAFTGRSARLRILAEEVWTDPADDDAAAQWCRAAMAIVRPDTLPGHYVNEVSDIGTDAAAIYGPEKAERLRALKRTWDPENVFHLNHNIRP